MSDQQRMLGIPQNVVFIDNMSTNYTDNQAGYSPYATIQPAYEQPGYGNNSLPLTPQYVSQNADHDGFNLSGQQQQPPRGLQHEQQVSSSANAYQPAYPIINHFAAQVNNNSRTEQAVPVLAGSVQAPAVQHGRHNSSSAKSKDSTETDASGVSAQTATRGGMALSRRSRSRVYPDRSDPHEHIPDINNYNGTAEYVTVGDGMDEGRNLFVIFDNFADGVPRTRCHIMIERGREQELGQLGSDWQVLPILPGLTLTQVCEWFPLHMWGSGLKIIMAEGWEPKDVYHALPPEMQTSRANQRLWNWIQQAMGREVDRANKHDGIQTAKNASKKRGRDEQDDTDAFLEEENAPSPSKKGGSGRPKRTIKRSRKNRPVSLTHPPNYVPQHLRAYEAPPPQKPQREIFPLPIAGARRRGKARRATDSLNVDSMTIGHRITHDSAGNLLQPTQIAGHTSTDTPRQSAPNQQGGLNETSYPSAQLPRLTTNSANNAAMPTSHRDNLTHASPILSQTNQYFRQEEVFHNSSYGQTHQDYGNHAFNTSFETWDNLNRMGDETGTGLVHDHAPVIDMATPGTNVQTATPAESPLMTPNLGLRGGFGLSDFRTDGHLAENCGQVFEEIATLGSTANNVYFVNPFYRQPSRDSQFMDDDAGQEPAQAALRPLRSLGPNELYQDDEFEELLAQAGQL